MKNDRPAMREAARFREERPEGRDAPPQRGIYVGASD